jgi:hypothetical protein
MLNDTWSSATMPRNLTVTPETVNSGSLALFADVEDESSMAAIVPYEKITSMSNYPGSSKV